MDCDARKSYSGQGEAEEPSTPTHRYLKREKPLHSREKKGRAATSQGAIDPTLVVYAWRSRLLLMRQGTREPGVGSKEANGPKGKNRIWIQLRQGKSLHEKSLRAKKAGLWYLRGFGEKRWGQVLIKERHFQAEEWGESKRVGFKEKRKEEKGNVY